MGRKLTLLWSMVIVVMTAVALISGVIRYQQDMDSQRKRLLSWGEYYVEQLRTNDAFRFSSQQLALHRFQLRYVVEEAEGMAVAWENGSDLPIALLDQALTGQRQMNQLSIGGEEHLVLALPVGASSSLVMASSVAPLMSAALRQAGAVLLANLAALVVLLAFSQRRSRRLAPSKIPSSRSWEHMNGVAFLLSQNRYISEVNHRFRNVFGDDDCRKLDDLLVAEERQQVLGYIDQALESQVMIDFECYLTDQYGEPGRWALHIKPWGPTSQRVLLITGDDISKRHHMELELRSEQQRVSAYFNAMQTLLVICDQYGNIERVNQQTLAMLDMDENALLGASVRNMLPKSQTELLLTKWRDLITSDLETLSIECPLVSASGKEAMVSWRLTKVIDRDMGRIEVVLAGLDITESVANRDALELANRQIREALSQAENANHSKSVFLANMSHEIRTPMNGILGAAELLLDSEMDTDQRNYLEIIHSSSHVLLDIINDILDLSKIESGNLEVETIDFDLNKLLADLYQLFREPARRKGLALVYFYDADTPTQWRGDPKRIRQIITNLVNNALKFTEHGRVEIRVRAEETEKGRYQLEMSVQDSGIGISADKIDRVFTAFRQADTSTSRKYGGTGLGLTISRHLAQAMGGDIVVQSELGRGSRFSLKLNLTTSIRDIQIDEQRAQGQEDEAPGVLRGQVLLAEDNHVNQRIAEKMLQRLGLQCHIVENGEQAVTEVLQKDYDLILMDVNMPVLDGITATERIRDLSYPKNQVPILALTANAMMEDKDRCMQAGMNGFVSKPIKLDYLAKAIAAILNRGVSTEG